MVVVFVVMVVVVVLYIMYYFGDGKVIWPAKMLHQKPLAMIVDTSVWGPGPGYSVVPIAIPPACQHYRQAAGFRRFAWKMAVKTVCVCL